jgi:2-amino-4-hydroxy-6-hydroxymethyldihydropteridine diphosphokinase
MVDVYVGVGSNVEPKAHIAQALELLGRHFGPLRCSQLYQSPAFGFEGPDFLNAVIAFESDLAPVTIEAVLSEVERAGGRAQARRAGSRTLDLDLLLYGARVDARERLPRADVLHYPFVLAPLAELAPELPHPLTGIALVAAWCAMAANDPCLTRRGPMAALIGFTNRCFDRRRQR